MRQLGKTILDFIEIHLLTAVFFLLLTSVSIEIFSRYVLNEPTPKFFELTIYSFVWTIYLGAAVAKRYNQHIRFDIFHRKFSKKTRLLIDIFFDTVVGIVFLIILVPSIKYTIWNYRIKASALRIPWTYLLVVFPIFVILILIHNSKDIFMNIRELVGKGTYNREELPWQ
jgi:TRAP-type C4-dicarboxylate transport system permease small subunit